MFRRTGYNKGKGDIIAIELFDQNTGETIRFVYHPKDNPKKSRKIPQNLMEPIPLPTQSFNCENLETNDQDDFDELFSYDFSSSDFEMFQE